MFLLHFSRFKTFLFFGHSKIKVRSCVLCVYAGTPLILHTRVVTAYLEMMYPFTLHSTWVSTVHISRIPTTWQTMCRVEYLKRYLYLLRHWKTIPLSTLICVKVPRWTFSWRWLFCSYKLFLSNWKLCSMRKLPRDCAWRNKDHVCGLRKNNIPIEIYRISRLN